MDPSASAGTGITATGLPMGLGARSGVAMTVTGRIGVVQRGSSTALGTIQPTGASIGRPPTRTEIVVGQSSNPSSETSGTTRSLPLIAAAGSRPTVIPAWVVKQINPTPETAAPLAMRVAKFRNHSENRLHGSRHPSSRTDDEPRRQSAARQRQSW